MTVSAAGRVTLRRTRAIRPRAQTTKGPAKLRLKVAARAAARKALRRRGRVRALARIVYRPAGQAPIERKKRLVLKLDR